MAADQGLVEDVVVDAKSGVTGAGRGPKETSLYAEVAEGITAYAVANHRHMPEIEQGLSAAAGRAIAVSFTPHPCGRRSQGMRWHSQVPQERA